MQLIMRRPEVTKFIAISPQPNVYDFSFLAPCPISGLIIYGKNDELVQVDSILNLKKRLNMQKNMIFLLRNFLLKEQVLESFL